VLKSILYYSHGLEIITDTPLFGLVIQILECDVYYIYSRQIPQSDDNNKRLDSIAYCVARIIYLFTSTQLFFSSQWIKQRWTEETIVEFFFASSRQNLSRELCDLLEAIHVTNLN